MALAEYQNEYKWFVRLYFDARDAAKGQQEIDADCATVLDAFRADPCINQTCMFSMIQRADIFFAQAEKDFLMVELELLTTDIRDTTNIANIRDGIKSILDGTSIFVKVNEYNQKTLPKLPAADIWLDGWSLTRHFGGNL